MTEIYAPGVRVEEANLLPSPGAVYGASAVPVFIGSFYDTDGNSLADDNKNPQKLVWVDSWLDFTRKCGMCNKEMFGYNWNRITATGSGREFSLKSQIFENERYIRTGPFYSTFRQWFDFDGYYSLMLYFTNGGGGCYLYPVKVSGLSGTPQENLKQVANNAAALISATPDITLAVICVGRDNANSEITLRTDPILKKCFEDRGIFLIANHMPEKPFERASVALPAQTAVYSPLLRLSRPLSLPDGYLDNAITVVMVIDKSSPGSARTLSALNKPESGVEDKAVYAQIHEILDHAVIPVLVGPAAAMAGVYCQTDLSRGVWKAPANVVLKGVAGLSDTDYHPVSVTDTLYAQYTRAGVNAVRRFTGRGLVVSGCRTAVETDKKDALYIPVRRLFNQVERDVREMMAGAVFEPNTPATWEPLRAAIDSYLHGIWTKGGLAGASPREAWRVQIGAGTSMSQSDISTGIMRVLVALAAVKPAEFIVLEFSQNSASGTGSP